MFRRIFDRHKLQVAIIACGDTGQEMGAEMIRSLKKFGANVKALSITSSLEMHNKKDVFNQIVSIDDNHDGFAKKLDDGIQATRKNIPQIDEALRKIVPDNKEDLMLIVTGAGGTGLGSTLVLVDHLYEKYRKVPPIITLLPETFENSRVQYNISTFLYDLVFKPENRGNSVLLLDNKPHFKEMSQPFSDVSRKRIDSTPSAFADLLFGSFEESVSEEFDAKVSDLFEVIHTPGLSVFISEELAGTQNDDIDSSRISDVIAESVMSTTSLSRDQVFDAKNAFITLFNIDEGEERLSFQTEFEARKLSRLFKETHPFIKIVSSDDKNFGKSPKLRGILTGLALPNRVLQVMRIARRSRKQIMIKEHNLMNDAIPLDIDKISRLEDKLRGIE